MDSSIQKLLQTQSKLMELCANTPGRLTPTISASLNQTTHGQCIRLRVSNQGHYTFLYGHTKPNREGGRKEQTNKRRLRSTSSSRGRSLWQFCVALRTFTDYRRPVLAQNFHKATRNDDSSLDCPVLLTGLFCSFLLTVLFSPPLPTDSLCLLWDLLSLLHFRSGGISHPPALCVNFASKQTKGFSDRYSHKQKRMLPIVSQLFTERLVAPQHTYEIDYVGRGPRKFYHRISLCNRRVLVFLDMAR